MTKIKSGSTVVGRPGFKRSVVKGVFTGVRVGKNRVSRLGTTRLFARDPSKRTALIGTSQDVNFVNKNVNTTIGSDNPRKLRYPHDLKNRAAGVVRVRDRSANRRVKER